MKEETGSQDSGPHTLVLSDPARSDCAERQLRPADAVRVWRDASLCGSGVEATVARLSRHRFAPHTHDTLMLGMIETGTKAFARGRETCTAPAGTISVVNPGDMHTGYRLHGEELRYRGLYVAPAVLADATDRADAASAFANVSFRSGVITDPVLFAHLVAAHEALLCGEPRLVREHRLLAALVSLASRYGDRPAMRDRAAVSAWCEVKRVRAMIDDRFADELSIADLAAAVGMSNFYLMRRFRDQVGLPIHAYQIQRRIERGKHLLAAGEPIVDVALQLGFADQSHFTKRFKSLVGTTPAAYRRDVSC